MSLRTFLVKDGINNRNNNLYCNKIYTRYLTVDNILLKNVIIDTKYNGHILYINKGNIEYKKDYEERILYLERVIYKLTNKQLNPPTETSDNGLQ